MRTCLGVFAVAAVLSIPITVAPASAQIGVETPAGGIYVGPARHYRDRYRHRDEYRHRRGWRDYGYDRGCRTTTIERADGSVRTVRRCR
jgi:hypothetical protein